MNKPHNTNSYGDNDFQADQTALNEQQLQQINDLADGQLHGEGFANAMSLLNNSSHARAVWHRLHVVGNVLRSHELAICQSDSDFIQRMKLSLQQEPAIQPISVSTLQTKNIASSANDGIFIWKSVAGLASLMGVIAVSWSLFNGTINDG
ncbi:MAG TPA: RseA family anti-sigma factor, partial [Burkholderiaceae bacterium]|nr:RseA family anti-sigma factor [Burkholderiaceae bacterium]